jgi:hypothetical protein
MKILPGSFKSIFLVFLIAGVLPVKAQHIIIGSYNLRYDNKNEVGNLWQDRFSVISSLIQFHQFNILGTEEGFRNQLDDLNKALPEFDRYGIGRDDGSAVGEHSAIFFNKNKFSLVEKRDFGYLKRRKNQARVGMQRSIVFAVG